MGSRESTAIDWPFFTPVCNFQATTPFAFGLLHSIGNNFDILWTEIASYVGAGDGLLVLGTIEFSIIHIGLGLFTAMGYATMADTSLMSEYQQVSLFRWLSLGYFVCLIVMSLSGSVGHGNLDMMMSNSWLSLVQFWVSITVTDATSFHAARVFFPLPRGVIVRVMMIWFIHGVFPGVLGVFSLETIIVNSDFMKICNSRRIWDPGVTSETFAVYISNRVDGVKCTIGWACTSIMPNFLIHAMVSISNWYRNPEILKLIPGTMDLFGVMWRFKERMPRTHTYHIRVRWILKKEHIMSYTMIASKAYPIEASSNSLFRLFHLQYMTHKFAYVITCFRKVLYWLYTVVVLII